MLVYAGFSSREMHTPPARASKKIFTTAAAGVVPLLSKRAICKNWQPSEFILKTNRKHHIAITTIENDVN